jgi:hypothetical protein
MFDAINKSAINQLFLTSPTENCGSAMLDTKNDIGGFWAESVKAFNAQSTATLEAIDLR